MLPQTWVYRPVLVDSPEAGIQHPQARQSLEDGLTEAVSYGALNLRPGCSQQQWYLRTSYRRDGCTSGLDTTIYNILRPRMFLCVASLRRGSESGGRIIPTSRSNVSVEYLDTIKLLTEARLGPFEIQRLV